MGAPHRVFGYCRVSSIGQEKSGTSLEGQRDEITRWCAAQGYPPPALFVEVESGSAEKKERRFEQVRLTATAASDDLVVVVAVDRWSRDIVHAVSSVRALVKRGVRWYAIREALDATTPHGDQMLGFMATIADAERRRIRERTVGRRQQLTDQGLYVASRPPYGFATKARHLCVDPAEAAFVTDVFERCCAGSSCADIAKALPPLRGRSTWDPQAVYAILTSRYLLGEARQSDGAWKPDVHPAVVDHDTWERAQAALKERSIGGRKFSSGQTATFLLRGIVRCARCGRRVAVRPGGPIVRKSPDVRVHYYICRGALMRDTEGAQRCDGAWLHAVRLDARAEGEVLQRLEALRADLAQPIAVAASPEKGTSAAAQLAQIEAKRRRTIDALTDGVLSKADAKDALARYEEQAARLRRAQERETAAVAATQKAADPETRAALLANVGALRAAWANMPVDARREVVTLLAERVEVARGVFRLTWRPVAALAAKGRLVY